MRQTDSTKPAPGNGGESLAAKNASAEFVTFTLGSEEFGVDIMLVREIRGWVATTPIPHAPDYVRGVINLRGLIVPILDLRSRFRIGVTEATKTHVVIIVNNGTQTVGLLADTVFDIINNERQAIQPIPESVSVSQEKILNGLAILDGGRLVTLVSLTGLFGNRNDAGTASESKAA